MKKYVVYNDTHLLSPYDIFMELEKGAIYNGDIVDLKNCKKSQIDDAMTAIQVVSNFAGDKYNRGNHELDPDRLHDFYKEDGIIFTHGHVQVWGEEKALKYAQKSPGAGPIERFFAKLYNEIRKLRKGEIAFETLERCWDLAKKHGCWAVVIGHKHPKNGIYTTYKKDGYAVTVLALPRGRNEIEL